MMDRCNIKLVVSRGGEKKAMSSPGRLFLLLPSLFTPCNYQSDGRYNSNTQGHPNMLAKLMSVTTAQFKCTQMYLCIYTRTFSEINPGWSQTQHCFHLRRFLVWNHAILLRPGFKLCRLHVHAHTCTYTGGFHKIKGKCMCIVERGGGIYNSRAFAAPPTSYIHVIRYSAVCSIKRYV